MDKEIHYEGWLIKSPPTKRIWRARWRRRYFALKQGELPGQYLLEYYTDETCRKLKGVIDLDQCEQVDAGLFMERKFPFVFNVRTPQRTYYLAADTDDAMRYWVNCICNVCGLQDLSKVDAIPSASPAEENQPQPSYFNVVIGGSSNNPESSASTIHIPTTTVPQHSNEEPQDDGPEHDYCNDSVLRRRPEELIITNTVHNTADPGEISPLSTSSGPYIPICECFSGTSVLPAPLEVNGGGAPFAEPLNSLNRLDWSRVPLTIGNLNLIDAESQQPPTTTTTNPVTPNDVVRSSDESESVFTDDDDTVETRSSANASVKLRALRPSDSSIENENIGWTATHRYSKVPLGERKCLNNVEPPPRPPKKGTPIGPLDNSSCVAEERYEIPRSHRNTHLQNGSADTVSRAHFYTNAAPRTNDGQVFRYDFSDDGPAPPPTINRSLKPKPPAVIDSSRSCEQIELAQTPAIPEASRASRTVSRQSWLMAGSRSDDRLQYLDLDHTNGLPSSPAPQYNFSSSVTIQPAAVPPPPPPTIPAVVRPLASFSGSIGSGSDAASLRSGCGIVYKTVDFVKTQAFNRTRQDAEMNRATNKDK